MSSTENAPINAAIQINWKTKRDGMLINIRANDATQLDVLLDAVTQRLATLIDLEKTTESMGAPAPSVNSIATQLGATPVASAQGYKPAGSTPDCSCGGGPMRAVPAGIAKATGRPYKGFYACPKPQGQACANKVTP
jgi:hypothetical protein